MDRKFLEAFLISFLSGIVIFSIIIFAFLKPELPINNFIMVTIGSLAFSFLYCFLWIISTKLIRPRAIRYFMHHENLKQIEKLGLSLNEKINGYSGNYRDYELTICCSFGEVGSLLTTEYVINIFFKPESAEKINSIELKHLDKTAKIGECVLQDCLSFKFSPPKYGFIEKTLNNLIDTLENNGLKPIRTEEIEKIDE